MSGSYFSALHFAASQPEHSGAQYLSFMRRNRASSPGGAFRGIEAAVAMSYPEPKNAGKFLGVWLSFRVAGQVSILPERRAFDSELI